MEVTVSYEEIATEQKLVIGELQHELLMKNIVIKKQAARIAEMMEQPRQGARPIPQRRFAAVPGLDGSNETPIYDEALEGASEGFSSEGG